VVQFENEASQTRGYCVAKYATPRAARADSLGFARDRLFATRRVGGIVCPEAKRSHL